MNLLERIRERAISPYTNMIATVFLALGMGMAMAQDNLSLTPATRNVNGAAGSTPFTVTTNIPTSELTVTMDEEEWAQATAAAAWSARYSHTSVVFDNKMWVIGGPSQNDVWSSTDGVTWTQATAAAGWSGRSSHTSVVFDNKMWVIGGDDGDELNDVWSSTDGITWTRATANAAWSARDNHTSVVFDNKMWVIGGWDGSRLDDAWHSTDGITWVQATADAAWSGRWGHTSVVFDNKMWVIGGYDGSRQDDVWSSTDGITWTQVTTTGTTWSARYSHTSVVFDNKMWVIGGYDGDELNDVWSSTDGITWVQATAAAAWSGRWEHTSVVFADKIWVIEGHDGSSQNDVFFFGNWLTASLSGSTLTTSYTANFLADSRTGTITVSGRGLSETATVVQDPLLGALSPETQPVASTAGSTTFAVTTALPASELTITADTWTQATAAAPWSGRWEHTSVVFDNKMWVIGGDDGSDELNDVWHSTDGITWTQATAAAPWSARQEHTSVVFDNKMWVIGGYDGSSQNDVWHSTDGITWTEATADAAWSARWIHTSVVFDNKMWVIGGSSGGNDVWSSTDGINWVQATASAAWSARSSHTSVVFDNKMWVIGGSRGFDELNDVWSSTDGINWTQATAVAPWSGHHSHTSVVFANKMWVIGGHFRQDDVWSSTDGITWTQATANALWPGREEHTSVVFDNKMWVIGGVFSRQNYVYFSEEWLTTELSGSSSPYTLTAAYEANGIVAVPRTGTITVSGRGLAQTVTVTQAGIPTELALSHATQSVSAETGSTNFTVTTNLSSDALTITDDADWLTVSLSGTSSPYTLTADYEVNSIAAPRTGTVTVTGGGLTQTVTVTQAGAAPELALSPGNQDVTAEAGSTSFMVTTNIPSGELTITKEENTDWLTVSSLSGSASPYTLAATCSENSIAAIRTGTVTVSGGGLDPRTVTVTQAGAAPELALSPGNQDVTAEAGSTTFMVTTNIPSGELTITDDAGWLTVSLSGTTLTADYEANSDIGPRTGTMTVSGGGLAETVTVAQAGATPELGLSPATQSVSASAGNTDFTMTTNVPSVDLTITDDADWLTLGLIGTTLTADYGTNGSTLPRTGTITISGGGLSETMTVVQAGAVPELVLSPATQSVTAEAGSTDFMVITNVPSGDLTITDDADWLTVSLSGTTLAADYEANSSTSPRTGTVTVSGGGFARTVTVVQAQAGVTFELALSPATQSVTNEAGSTNFTVTTNLPSDALTTIDDADWLTVSLSGTSSPYTLTATYEANSDTGPRTGTITISGGGFARTVTVVQDGADAELALSPANQDVSAEAGSTDFTMTTNVPSVDLTITDDADWLTLGLIGTTLTADYGTNGSAAPRTGTITVSGGGLTETVTVEQDGADAELALSPATQDVSAEAESTDFTVTTNLPSDALTITDDADWMTTELSGTTLTATYEANESTDPRTGTVTVSSGGLTQTVTVEQEGTPLGLEDETALVVYPNPGSAQVTVDFGDMAQGEGKEWMLLDPSGRKVLSGAVARGEATLVIPTQGLLSGLYLFQARGEGQNAYISHRVVIRH